MRRAFNDKQWLFDEEKFIGINLGWDFTSEHEWGIKDLYQHLNVSDDEKICGIDRRRVGEVSPDNVFFDKKKGVLIVSGQSSIEYLKEAKKFNPGERELQLYGDEDLATAWDGHSFGIYVKGKENIEKLEQLHDALMNKNVIVFLGGSSSRKNPFARSGLTIVIYDRIPEDGAKEMKGCDEDYLKLKKASEKTGIQKKIDAFNKKSKPGKQVYAFAFDSPCGYYALSPKWKFNPGREIKTKHPVIYWLNPMKQDETNFGWFAVEELLQWMEGKGPIPKEKEKVENAN